MLERSRWQIGKKSTLLQLYVLFRNNRKQFKKVKEKMPTQLNWKRMKGRLRLRSWNRVNGDATHLGAGNWKIVLQNSDKLKTSRLNDELHIALL